MKASTRLRKATKLQNNVHELLSSVTQELNAIAGEGELSVYFQDGDGLCINDAQGNNSKVLPNEVDAPLKMSKDELFNHLARNRV